METWIFIRVSFFIDLKLTKQRMSIFYVYKISHEKIDLFYEKCFYFCAFFCLKYSKIVNFAFK